MAVLSFVLVSFVFVISQLHPDSLSEAGDLFSLGFLYLSLLGFVGSMIFGVELKTTVFRVTNYSKDLAKSTVMIQGFAILVSFFGAFGGSTLTLHLPRVLPFSRVQFHSDYPTGSSNEEPSPVSCFP